MLKMLYNTHYEHDGDVTLQYEIVFDGFRLTLIERFINSYETGENYYRTRKILVKADRKAILEYREYSGAKVIWGAYNPPKDFNMDLFRYEIWKYFNIDIPEKE